MPLVLLQPAPEASEVVFMTFENSEEIDAREQQHAGEMVAIVVEAPRRRGFMKASHGK